MTGLPAPAGASDAAERAASGRQQLAAAAYWDASGSRPLSAVLNAPFGARAAAEHPRGHRHGAALWLRFSPAVAGDAYLVVHGYDGSGTLYAPRPDGSLLATPFYAGGMGGTLRTGPERIVLHPAHPSRQTYYVRLTPDGARPISLALVAAPALDERRSGARELDRRAERPDDRRDPRRRARQRGARGHPARRLVRACSR